MRPTIRALFFGLAAVVVMGCTASAGDADVSSSESNLTQQKVVLYGGYGGHYLFDTWEWNGSTWTNRPITGPYRWPSSTPGFVATDAMATLNGKAVFFNWFHTRRSVHQVWQWDGTTWTSRETGGPAARNFTSVASLNGKLVMFGGDDLVQTLSDTWAWDGTNWIQKNLGGSTHRHTTQPVSYAPTPPSRAHHAMASANGKILLFGGYGPSQAGLIEGAYLADTWEWNGTGWSENVVAGPPPRGKHAMAELNGKIVLFGGHYFDRTYHALGDTWEWDGTTWTQRAVNGPPARWNHSLATFNGKVVLFGGTDGGNRLFADTWEWNGTTWTQRNVSGPSARENFAMTSY